MTKFPSPLKKGGTIGIVSPDRWAKPDWLEGAKAFFEKQGYKVVIHPQNYLKAMNADGKGQMAGSIEAQAAAIAEMFVDKNIDAIVCARGGTGLTRILDALDYDLIKSNPKPFVGFSAITGLLNAINQRCGFVTYHGPMALSFAMEHDPRTEKDFFTMLGAGNKDLTFSSIDVIRPGQAEGRLIGGNMTSLQCLIGTKFDWMGKDTILVIEDVDEILYKIDRTLEHFKQAGKLQNLRAVIVGEMVDTPDGESQHMRPGDQPYGRDLRQILLDVMPADIPLCANFPCGHGKYMTTLPVGAEAQLTLDKSGATLQFKSA